MMLITVYNSKIRKAFERVALECQNLSQSTAILAANDAANQIVGFFPLVEACTVPLTVAEALPNERAVIHLNKQQYDTLYYVVNLIFNTDEADEKTRYAILTYQPAILGALEAALENYDVGDIQQNIFSEPKEKV